MIYAHGIKGVSDREPPRIGDQLAILRIPSCAGCVYSAGSPV